MIKLIKLVQVGQNYSFDEVLINPESITLIEENYFTRNTLLEESSRFPAGLSEGTRFSTVLGNGFSHTVVGAPDTINEKISNRRTLLKG